MKTLLSSEGDLTNEDFDLLGLLLASRRVELLRLADLKSVRHIDVIGDKLDDLKKLSSHE